MVGKDIQIANDISSLMGIKPVIAETNLKQLAALIQRCRLFITNNSGPMHIAAAMKTPHVVLWGPTKVYQLHPYYNKDKSIVIKKDVSCSPYNRSRCRKHTDIKFIKPEEVLRAADVLLKRFV